MLIKRIFHLLTDSSDLLDFFADVTTPEQLVSRLERLKRQAPEELLACVEGLRVSVEELFNDTIETSGTIDEQDDLEDDPDLKNLMRAVDDETAGTDEVTDETPEDTTSEKTPDQKDSSSDVTPAT